MNILAIGCHPDDIEVACAGTLLKCKARGDEIFMLAVCNGNMGHKIIQPQQLAAMRKKEFEASAEIAGAKAFMLGIDDLNAFDNKEQRDKLIAVLKEIKPGLIITHAPNDYMPDHRAVSDLVFGAGFTATLGHYPPVEKGAAPLAAVAYMDNLAGSGFIPAEYVDISDFIDKKLEMLECHVSQLKWMRDHDKIDFAEFVRASSRARGLQCGTHYAEGFTMCNVWGRARAERMLP